MKEHKELPSNKTYKDFFDICTQQLQFMLLNAIALAQVLNPFLK